MVKSFRFLDLPGEQRNAVYRYLLDDLVKPISTPLNAWDKEWPTLTFSAYLQLIRTCRKIHAEVSSIFEQEYLPKVVFHFSDVHSLYEFDQRRRSTVLKRHDISFRLRCWNEYFAGGARQLLHSTMNFMQAQPTAIASDDLRSSPEFCRWLRRIWDVSQSEDYRGLWEGRHSYICRHERGIASYALEFDVLCPEQPLIVKVESRELNDTIDKSWSIEGKFEDLDWSEWDEREIVKARQGWKMWRESAPKRAAKLTPFETTLAKRKRSSSTGT